MLHTHFMNGFHFWWLSEWISVHCGHASMPVIRNFYRNLINSDDIVDVINLISDYWIFMKLVDRNHVYIFDQCPIQFLSNRPKLDWIYQHPTHSVLFLVTQFISIVYTSCAFWFEEFSIASSAYNLIASIFNSVLIFNDLSILWTK